MLALRYAAVVALAVWIGGLIALGALVAPSIFGVLDASGMAGGRTLAGTLFGEILRRFHYVAYVCGAVVLASLAARGVLGPRPRRFSVRLAILAAILAATVYSGLVVSPEVVRMQQSIGAAPSTLASEDPRRAAFGRLHATSTALHVVALIGALGLVYGELRD